MKIISKEHQFILHICFASKRNIKQLSSLNYGNLMKNLSRKGITQGRNKFMKFKILKFTSHKMTEVEWN